MYTQLSHEWLLQYSWAIFLYIFVAYFLYQLIKTIIKAFKLRKESKQLKFEVTEHLCVMVKNRESFRRLLITELYIEEAKEFSHIKLDYILDLVIKNSEEFHNNPVAVLHKFIKDSK